MNTLEEYYNKFNEDKRLLSRHGQVEFAVTIKYIRKYLKTGDRIIDIGAGTGRYSIELFNEGYDVTAIEPVQHNLGIMKQKCPGLKAYKRNAMKLNRIESGAYDIALLLGPLYHLTSFENKLRALAEAKRVIKPGGLIFAAYLMNEYSVITYAFKERHILENLSSGQLDSDFHIIPKEDDLYDHIRIEDIDRLNEKAGFKRILIFSPDGPSDYIRPFLNQLSEEEFEKYIEYQLSVCERPDLIGAGSHTVDIVTACKI